MIEPLPSNLVELLAAQQKVDELRREAIRRAGSHVCDLAYANPYGGPAKEAVCAMAEALRSDRPLSLQYTPYGGAKITRRLIAEQLSSTHGGRYKWRDVVMTPGAMAGLNILFRALRGTSDPGEVVVITPCWLDYPLYLANLGLEARFVGVRRESGRLDLDGVRRAVGTRTRAVVLSQPANPTGVVYSREELQGLADVLRASPRPPLLISDEAQRDFVAPGSDLHLPSQVYDATCVVYSFGKGLYMQGQRIGYVAVSPRFAQRDVLAKRLEEMCRIMGFCTPTALMQLAIRKLIGHRPSLEELTPLRDSVMARLSDAGYAMPGARATFFLYPRVPDGDDMTFCERLARRGVLVLPASMFHDSGSFRISLTGTREMIDGGVEILEDVA